MEIGKIIPGMGGGKPDVLVLGEVLVELTAPVALREADTLRLSCSGDALNAAGRPPPVAPRWRWSASSATTSWASGSSSSRARARSTRRTFGARASRTASTSRVPAASSCTRGAAARARRSGPTTWRARLCARPARSWSAASRRRVGVVRGGGRRRGRDRRRARGLRPELPRPAHHRRRRAGRARARRTARHARHAVLPGRHPSAARHFRPLVAGARLPARSAPPRWP